MKTLELKTDILNFSEIIASTVRNNEETLVKSSQGSVVIIDQKNWEEIQETLLLLKDKEALNALLKGHKMRDSGKAENGKSVDEVFIDV